MEPLIPNSRMKISRRHFVGLSAGLASSHLLGQGVAPAR